MEKVNFVCNTDGRGFWSHRSKSIRISGVELFAINEDQTFGELIATFTKRSWNICEDGLIYTDSKWLKEFHQAMKERFNLSEKAIRDIEYSEQGMQGDDYVSMDVGSDFLEEWLKRLI